MLMINGLNLPDVGGGLPDAKELYSKVSKSIDKQINLAPQVKFQTDIKVAGDIIKVEVKGEKLPENSADLKLRLHLIITEKSVSLIAPNGVLKHENVVRSMPYGPYGRPYTDETLNFTQEFDVKTLRYNQEMYLQKYEKSKQGKFAAHPVDMNKLSVIVFVQSYATGHVVNTYFKALEQDFGTSSSNAAANGQNQDGLNRHLPPVPSLPE